ncbi:hypothetical protein [Actinomadura montaniterrae]|uniref:hypothetical protein n=1 Tax=Actinomadura montaniterrae TaxID=1803903 RepID=UPI00178C51D5|nr:hypothetical protein [Actinomadura montaniterrae]
MTTMVQARGSLWQSTFVTHSRSTAASAVATASARAPGLCAGDEAEFRERPEQRSHGS